ncbi:CaiB/BaiF CoA transferase family protein [Pseudonocardia sp. GCM10023141]|uniref:CaiB/BaiF CoA transferase family protein n=1 Tax=Pseudonocardia sp. GCM10023141 TaxID=3252653 RepID=UPI00360942E5
MTTPTGGALHGVRVLDMSALGPGPFCSMLLSDFGADVIAVERPETQSFDPAKFFSRGKRSAVVDLRAPGGPDVIARLADHADVFLESFRPGAMERRGLGPDVLCERNPRLVYARLTGWGQDGPYRNRAGHDINYIGVAGTLGVIGAAGSPAPVPPLATLGDIAGGSMVCALGIVMALFARATTGRGQVVDAAIVDGAALLNTPQLGELNAGIWAGRGAHLLSGAAPFYGVYRCSDDRWFAVGAIEAKFYAAFLAALELAPPGAAQLDPSGWDALREQVAQTIATKPRAHWSAVFADIDGCGTPVLDLDELVDDPHLRARATIVEEDGLLHAAPAPRLSRTPARRRPAPAVRGGDTRAVLIEAGFDDDEVTRLVADGTVMPGDA